MTNEENPMEMLAREVARMHLGVPVDHHDDGSRDAMPDARITYPDGRLGWLEVVTDTDGSYRKQQKALGGRDVLHVAGLRWTWRIDVRHHVNLKALARWLGPQLLEAETGSGGDPHRARALVDARGREKAKDRPGGEGCDVVYSMPLLDQPPGDVLVRSAIFSHSHGVNEMSGWVSTFFARHSDVAKKMSADGREEQHAFVWTTSDSGPEQAFVLAQRGLPFRPPAEDPPLPAGVTHLWVAGAGTADRAIAWFPHRGWHEVTGHWTRTPAGRAMLDSAGRGHLSR